MLLVCSVNEHTKTCEIRCNRSVFGLRSWSGWVGVLALSFVAWITLGKLLNFSEFTFVICKVVITLVLLSYQLLSLLTLEFREST